MTVDYWILARVIRQNELFNHLSIKTYISLPYTLLFIIPLPSPFSQPWIPYGYSCDGFPAGLPVFPDFVIECPSLAPLPHHCHHLTSYMWLGQFF